MVKQFLAVLALTLGFMTASAGAAATLNRSECEALGGTYNNLQGTKTCVLPVTETDPSGNSGNAWVVRGEESDSQQGVIGAPGTSGTFEEETTTTSCANPGGNAMKLTNPHCEL